MKRADRAVGDTCRPVQRRRVIITVKVRFTEPESLVGFGGGSNMHGFSVYYSVHSDGRVCILYSSGSNSSKDRYSVLCPVRSWLCDSAFPYASFRPHNPLLFSSFSPASATENSRCLIIFSPLHEDQAQPVTVTCPDR